MIGWGLTFIEIDGKHYGVGTSCWFGLEVGMVKDDQKKYKKLYDRVISNIMKYHKKGELRGLSRKEIDRIPSDGTYILKDGKMSCVNSKKRIHRVPPNYRPWTLMYTDQGPITMDLDELEEWVHIEDLKDKRKSKQKKAVA